AAGRRPHDVPPGAGRDPFLLRGDGGRRRGAKRRRRPHARPRALPRRGGDAGADALREGHRDPPGDALLPRPAQGGHRHHVREPQVREGTGRGRGQRLPAQERLRRPPRRRGPRGGPRPRGRRRRRGDAKGAAGEGGGGLGGDALGQAAGDPAAGGPRPPQRPHSLLAAHLGGHRQAPPGKRLRADGRPLPRRGGQGGALAGLDHHRGDHRRGRRGGL
ncbi:MAG: hypothetical protein AVDCRST_MAG05-2344, partial [uncultured Rubrobacteraceae bacterium]